MTAMQVGKDGGLYMAGADIYKMDVQTGEYEVAMSLAVTGSVIVTFSRMS